MKFNLIPAIILILSLLGCQQKAPELTPTEAKQIAKEAFIYGFPLVVNYKTLYAYTIDKNSPEYKGEFNVKSCEARVYTPEDKAIVTPNSDTPYCMFWSDIRTEPIVFTVPEIEDNRYYSFQFIDLFTHNFAYVGTIPTGNKLANTLLLQAIGREKNQKELPTLFIVKLTCFLQLFGLNLWMKMI